MNIEKIFRKIIEFEKLTIDTVLFEGKYPILFTCKNGDDIYLFICCLVHAELMKWIGTQTDDNTLIELLENMVTIRDAFLGVTDEKIMIEYDGQTVNYRKLKSEEIPKDLLPSDGEFMDAQEGEFAEEIAAFKLRSENIEYQLQPLVNQIFLFDCVKKNVELTDAYFNLDFEAADVIEYTIGKIHGHRAGFVR